MTSPNRPRWWHRFAAPQRRRSHRDSAPLLRLEPLEPRDVPATNTLTISDAVLLEGNGGTTNMAFTLTRTGDTTTDWQVGFETVNGTAVAGTDYTAQSGSAVIPAGSATATILVPIIGNTLDQKDRNFSVVLSGPVFVAGVPFVFAPRQTFAARPAPVGVVQADLNGDGKPDLITANKYGDDISVFMNTTAQGATAATFGARQDITTGSGPQAIVATDLNGDGKPDLAVCNTYSYTVTVMINLTTTGATAFAFGPKTNFNTSPGPLSLVTGDINGDGKPDLLTAGTTVTGGAYNILLNATAQGATTPAFTNGGTPAGATMAAALADVNGDGKVDLVGTGFGPGANSINVRLNTTPTGGSTLQFAASQNIATSQDISDIAVADVNGDGKPDFVTTSYSLSVVSVLLNTTTAGATTVAVSPRHDFVTVPFPVALQVTDMSGDGRSDLLVSEFGSVVTGPAVSVFRNLAAVGATVPSFGTRRDWAAGTGPRDVTAADLNRDGQPDIVEVDRFDDTLSVRLQNSVEITRATGTGMIVDDDTYLATGADASGSPLVRVFAPATGLERFSFFAYAPAFTGGVRVAVGDVTGDGVADIVTAPGPGGGPHVKVFDGVTHALTAEFFAYGASFTGGVFVAVGNFDADPALEIVTGAGAGGGPHVKVFNVAGGAATPLAGPIGSFFAYGASFTGGVSVAAGNVDGVGFDELITGAGPGGGPHVKAFRTDGSLAANFFAYGASFSGGVQVAAGDVNGDGTAEILTGPGAGGGQSVKVFRANATVVSSFVPYAGFAGAVRVTFEVVSGVAEIVTGPGPGLGPRVRRFDAATLTPLGQFDAYNPAFLGGIFVGGD